MYPWRPTPWHGFPAYPNPKIDLDATPAESSSEKSFDFGVFIPERAPRPNKESLKAQISIYEKSGQLESGVRLFVGIGGPSSSPLWAAYFNFKDTRNLKEWAKTILDPDIMSRFRDAVDNNFGGEKKVDAPHQDHIWKFLTQMKPIHQELLKSDEFPVTHTQMNTENGSHSIVCMNYIVQMNEMINTYPERFPDDDLQPQLHGHNVENWNRAHWMIRFWQKKINTTGELTKEEENAETTPLYFITDDDISNKMR